MKTLAPAQVSAFLDAIAQARLELHGLVILQHGKTVAEGWWHPYRADVRHQLFSLSKSFTSTAAGFAVTEGLISLDDPVLSFFPTKAPKEPNDFLKAMKIRHLLSMNTGHETEPHITESRDWVKGFLAAPPTKEPGTHFLYNSMATYMVSAIITKVTGQTVRDYLMPRLFTPLGIPEPEWDTCPLGISTGGWGLWLNTREISRFGQFLLQKGEYEGKRLLPASWIETASSIHSDNGIGQGSDWNQGYGFQFWRCKNGFYRGDGAFGQFCIVMEAYDMVVAANSGTNDMGGVMDLMWQHLIPTGSAKASKKDAAALAEKLAVLAYAPPALDGTPESAAKDFGTWIGSQWDFEKNELGFTGLAFDMQRGKRCVILEDGRGPHRVPFGWGTWSVSNGTLPQFSPRKRRKYETQASARWIGKNKLELIIRFPETPAWYTLVCTKKRTGMEMAPTVNISFGPTTLPVLMGRKRTTTP